MCDACKSISGIMGQPREMEWNDENIIIA